MRRAWTVTLAVVALTFGSVIVANGVAPPTSSQLISDAQQHLVAAQNDLAALAASLVTPTPSPTPTTTPTTTSSSTAPPNPTPSPTSTSGVGNSWAPPTLTNPTTLTLTNGVTPSFGSGDYILRCPSSGVWVNAHGLEIRNAHDVVFVGPCFVDVGAGYVVSGGDPRGSRNGVVRRASYILATTGEVYLRGITFGSSAGDLTEGIDISTKSGASIVTLQNIDFGAPLLGSYTTNHADCLQSWTGPNLLRVDGFACTTGYQGTFISPFDISGAPPVKPYILRNVEITGNAQAKYLLWANNVAVSTSNVVVKGGLGPYPNLAAWPGVTWLR